MVAACKFLVAYQCIIQVQVILDFIVCPHVQTLGQIVARLVKRHIPMFHFIENVNTLSAEGADKEPCAVIRMRPKYPPVIVVHFRWLIRKSFLFAAGNLLVDGSVYIAVITCRMSRANKVTGLFEV